ncbi:hypothetical protein GQ42DRAFT_164661 [Ramicandelaber brevisporus]|nr:hypothetical protein GQ42DRAFT_164661 [Ramicandelaber brevisporus]
MKLFYLGTFRTGSTKAEPLASATELSEFSFFQRPSVREFMTFFASTIAERTRPGMRQGVEQDSYMAYAYCRPDKLAAVAIVDKEYPSRVVFSLLNKILDEFSAKVGMYLSSINAAQAQAKYPEIEQHIQKYQDPRQADTIMRVQQELDETKVIMHKTIQDVLERGQKLDDLVAQSDLLSTQSKMFYGSAKKANSRCCGIM